VNTSGIYDKPVDSRQLTVLGHAAAEWLNAARDVREADLESFSLDERAHFANYSYYAMLLRSGVDPGEVRDYLNEAATGCRAVLEALEIADPNELLYSPFQQASDEVIARALELP
jgi:hypothetical protein